MDWVQSFELFKRGRVLVNTIYDRLAYVDLMNDFNDSGYVHAANIYNMVTTVGEPIFGVEGFKQAMKDIEYLVEGMD